MKCVKLFALLLSFAFFSELTATSSQVKGNNDEPLDLPNLVLLPATRSIWGITEDQLDDLFNNSNDYIVLANQTHYYRINDKYANFLGWSREEILAQPFCSFIHPEDLAASQQAAHESTTQSCILNFKNRHQTKKGDYHLIEWLTLLQVAGSDHATPVLAIGRDLTVEATVQEQQLALVQAQAATKMKSSFVAHMSQEIRTPLNGVLGFLEMTLEESLSPTVRSYVEQAQTSSQLLLGVANDIIDVSKIEAGAFKIEKVDFNPFQAINAVMAPLKLQAIKKDLTLRSTIDPDLPLLLCGDEQRLKQILFNLLGNAVKFTAQGNISLKIDGHPQTNNPLLFLLRGRVKDTGIGIHAEFLPKLFQPFSQEDHNMRRQFGGAGLGLYITKQLCERMGGTLEVMSVPGQGSTFQFHVILERPLTRSPHFSSQALNLAPQVLTSDLPPLTRILVVEDNLLNQKVMANLLGKLKYSFDIVDNGQRAVQAVKNQTYDLVLMDGEMPVMDGLEATRELRQRFSPQQLPIIGVSAHVMSDQRDLFLASGMNGYLAKPITKNDLMKELIRCFPKQPSQSSLPSLNLMTSLEL